MKYLDSQWLNFFSVFSFLYFGDVQGESGVKLGREKQPFDLSHIPQNLNFGDITQFLSANLPSLVKISAKSYHIWQCKGLNKPGKEHIMGAKLVSKTLKIFNLATTNATLMKLTTIVCIFKIPLVWEKLEIRHRV